MRYTLVVLPALITLGFVISTNAGIAQEKAILFEKKILPIFEARCIKCHGAKKQRAGLDLRSKGGILKGGESGVAIVSGSAKKSLLWKQVISNKMPPGKAKLSQAEKGLIRAWIDTGAHALNNAVVKSDGNSDRQVTDEDRKFWSFQPPIRPGVPEVKTKERVRNAVDAFVLASLEKKGLLLSPEAQRLPLLRRATFDLLGLPPSPKQIQEFLADQKRGAYERLIDRLLSNKHYGERWGRHWLDVAGYADSEGILDADYVRKAAWRYRDYVIRAFNNDMPYDRFLQEQIAGDELTDYWKVYRTEKKLPPKVVDSLTATGFLRCASDTSRPDFVNIKNAPGYYFQTLDDTVQIVSSSILGLTVGCAKCHSHKYDPIPQRDYYKLQAVFMSGYRPSQWVPQVKRKLMQATDFEEKQAKAQNAKIDKAIARLRNEIKPLQKKFYDRLFKERLETVPAKIREKVRVAFATNAKKRTKEQQALFNKFKASLVTAPAAIPKVLSQKYPEFKNQYQQFEKAVKAEEANRAKFEEIRAFYDLPGDATTHLLRRGDYLHPGPEVRPGVLAVLATPSSFDWKKPDKKERTSGRRLAFAKWITQPNHPLTARVMVNRIWLHHFGRGIVSTPDNFGRRGERPSHPELLDWLATEFVRQGWSIKAIHRLIMTSSAYRQASLYDPAIHAKAKKLDPDNQLLWRQRFRRLEAEALRDAVLSVAGALNPQMFGAPVGMQRRGDGEIVAPDGPAGWRRSIYLQVRRSQPLTFLHNFDQPVMQINCTRRDTSTVSSQALTLLNSDFMIKQSQSFADRVLRERPKDPARYALQLAFGRNAGKTEVERLESFLETQTMRHAQAMIKGQKSGNPEARRKALADLCHILMSANEFAYVD